MNIDIWFSQRRLKFLGLSIHVQIHNRVYDLKRSVPQEINETAEGIHLFPAPQKC